MYYRLAEILPPEDLGVSGTKILDITTVDIISRIEILTRWKNGSTNFHDHPAANVSKIELVDGSDVLFSLSGREAQAINFYDRKLPPDNHMTGSNGEYMRAAFGIDFGRWLFDTVLAFDPTKFTNPQLKLTWNEAIANTDCSENYVTILAHLFDEKVPAPTGFLTTKEQYTYTPVVNAYERVDLPTDYPIRKLLLGSHQETRTFSQMLAEIRLSEDNDKRVPFDIQGDELFWQIKQNYPEYIENIYMVLGATATAFRVTPSEDAVITGVPTSGVLPGSVVFQNGGLASGIVDTTPVTWYMITKGYIPHGYAAIPFGDQDDVADWYDVTKIGSLLLRIKGGPNLGTDPTTQVVTQQIRSYA